MNLRSRWKSDLFTPFLFHKICLNINYSIVIERFCILPSHRYWANFSTSYLCLEPIFLGPDSISMTQETWQSSKTSMIGIEIRFKTFMKQNIKYERVFLKCCTREPEYINVYGSNSKFPSTGPGSKVRVHYVFIQIWR